MSSATDSGPDFEVRALAMARAIHDPLGLQGASMVMGKERDGIFIDDGSINAYEFTVSPLKAKAVKDGEKLHELLRMLGGRPENRYKTLSGWLVTESEPTAEQRDAIRRIAADGETIHIISYQVLRARLCDVERYLGCRGRAPFGSISYVEHHASVDINPKFHDQSSEALDVRTLVERIASGDRALLVGEFGVGKSHALKELYEVLRKRYFKQPTQRPFPVHINLRDCAGLRSPSEVLRRHAEEIGFADERGLVSAWRAGACALLLDGFDEVIPSRWLGAVTTLKQVRWEALSPVRRLIREAPSHMGVIVAGRGHYFSSSDEMREVLGLQGSDVLRLRDFDLQQANELLAASGSEAVLPDWLPTKPLLLVHLLKAGVLGGVSEIHSDLDPADAWRQLLRMICDREANIYASVPPSTIQSLLQRLATVARSKGDAIASLAREDLERVFVDVSGRSTDEEVLQLLMRLPGLAVAADSGFGEVRVFADEDLADTAYGEDLAAYLSSPFQGHPLCEAATWSDAAGNLAIEVCASALSEAAIAPRQVLAACDHRMNHHLSDAILMDSVRVADELEAEPDTRSYLVEGVLLRELSVSPDSRVVARTHLRDSLIDNLDLTYVDSADQCPMIERCLIERVDGVSQLPNSLSKKLLGSSI
ncbi:MAG: hypothetical protein Q8P38_03390 [Candidatus Nanopelagicales bacterium]|nr:hypothetical protein [Candidatus Nanopelagicales bacterium]